jgi:hypothetical protein
VNNNQNCLINDLKPKIRWYFHFPKKPENFTYFTILCTNIQSASVLLIVALSLVVLVNPFSARSAGKNSLEEKLIAFSGPIQSTERTTNCGQKNFEKKLKRYT